MVDYEKLDWEEAICCGAPLVAGGSSSSPAALLGCRPALCPAGPARTWHHHCTSHTLPWQAISLTIYWPAALIAKKISLYQNITSIINLVEALSHNLIEWLSYFSEYLAVFTRLKLLMKYNGIVKNKYSINNEFYLKHIDYYMLIAVDSVFYNSTDHF